MRLMLVLLCSVAATAAATDRPNIVMIISDDQAWTDYSFMGHKTIQTPHLDRLAAESCTFPRGYVPIALCRPSLATMITGLYPHQHGITGNDPTPRKDLSKEEYAAQREALISKIDACPQLPRILGNAGYVSHQSGKWWEGNFSRAGFTAGMTRGFPQPGGRHGDDGLKIGRNGMSEVTSFIDTAVQDQKPFFVWYAPFLPHTPHNPPERILKKYQSADRPIQLAKYYAMCDWFDETCGQLLTHLDQTGVSDNTIVVYVTDNGWIQRTPQTDVPKAWKTSFAPKSKQSPNEGGTRTPIMIRWPKQLTARTYQSPISSIDLMPTLLAACDQKIPERLPGRNLLPYLDETKPTSELDQRPILGESFAHDVADINNPQATLLYRWVILDQWKLLLTYDGKVNRYNPVHLRENIGPQLYHLGDDPHENKNVAADHPDKVKQMASLIQDWWTADQRKTQTTVSAE